MTNLVCPSLWKGAVRRCDELRNTQRIHPAGDSKRLRRRKTRKYTSPVHRGYGLQNVTTAW